MRCPSVPINLRVNAPPPVAGEWGKGDTGNGIYTVGRVIAINSWRLESLLQFPVVTGQSATRGQQMSHSFALTLNIQ